MRSRAPRQLARATRRDSASPSATNSATCWANSSTRSRTLVQTTALPPTSASSSTTAPVALEQRRAVGLPPVTGLLVRHVDPGGPAASKRNTARRPAHNRRPSAAAQSPRPSSGTEPIRATPPRDLARGHPRQPNRCDSGSPHRRPRSARDAARTTAPISTCGKTRPAARRRSRGAAGRRDIPLLLAARTGNSESRARDARGTVA